MAPSPDDEFIFERGVLGAANNHGNPVAVLGLN
jgi:LmbE family N-acetylglucosaminyl deacetylase